MSEATSATVNVPHPMVGSGSMGAPTIITYYRFSEDWFRDALWETRDPDEATRHARRREVVFSVCFAEAYLFEWVAHRLDLDLVRLATYFPAGDNRGIWAKWKEIPQALVAHGVMPSEPDISKKHARRWQQLIEFRNGLIHAHASWPEVLAAPAGTAPAPAPRPTAADFARLRRGWPLAVAVERVRRLHAAAGTNLPEWITAPMGHVTCEHCGGRPRRH
jgi:hypothetical protein